MTWKQLTERDRREWKLSAIDPHDRHLEIWCEICHACSKPVAWKGIHCCGYGWPLYLHVNQKSDDDDDDDDDFAYSQKSQMFLHTCHILCREEKNSWNDSVSYDLRP